MKQHKYLRAKYYFKAIVTASLYCDNLAQCEYAQLEIISRNG